MSEGLFTSLMKQSIRALVVALATTSLASPALANTVGTNAIQLTLTQAANSQIGVTQGGQFAIQGSGLDTVAIPTISATGIVSAGTTALTVTEDAAFSYLATIRQADVVAIGASIGETGQLDTTGTFSDLTSSSSVGSGSVGTIAIDTTGDASIAHDTAGAGSTLTGIISSTNAGRYAQVENRRIVSASTTQNITDSDVQQSKFSISGTGMDGITDGGFNSVTGAAGETAASVVLEGGACSSTSSQCGSGGSFNLTQETTVGQDAATMNVTSTALTTPAYGIVDYSVGGTSSGAIALTDLNTVTATGGGAGTTASLSLVSELTAFN